MAKGFEIKSVEITPNIIKISGAEQEIKKLKYVKTDIIDISGKKSTIATEIS